MQTVEKAPLLRAILSTATEEALVTTDWGTRDVLVGSFGSVSQFEANIEQRFYYVPERMLSVSPSSVRHVALYQSVHLFGEKAGIVYYGEVIAVKRMKRKKIPVPVTHNNAEEVYLVFLVREWKTLECAIGVSAAGVYAPRMTNLFLLLHSTHSYELFDIHSPAEFRLLHILRHLFKHARDYIDAPAYFRIDGTHALRVQGDTLALFHNNNLVYTLTVPTLIVHPRKSFTVLTRQLQVSTEPGQCSER